VAGRCSCATGLEGSRIFAKKKKERGLAYLHIRVRRARRGHPPAAEIEVVHTRCPPWERDRLCVSPTFDTYYSTSMHVRVTTSCAYSRRDNTMQCTDRAVHPGRAMCRGRGGTYLTYVHKQSLSYTPSSYAPTTPPGKGAAHAGYASQQLHVRTYLARPA
jgi:hypothetical protein